MAKKSTPPPDSALCAPKTIHKLVVNNLRLKELVAIVRKNEPFFREFENFLKENGFENLHSFIHSKSPEKTKGALAAYFEYEGKAKLFDGIGNEYASGKAKWYFLAWILRDAPAQRLNPIVSSVEGESLDERRVNLLDEVRRYAAPLFPSDENWAWESIAEVMLARLEGSRRSLKGGELEEKVRIALRNCLLAEKIRLKVGDKQVKIGEQTYDVQLYGKKTILMPVKTRETMGGGHAGLFTRDITEAVKAAHDAGHVCIPVVIAESWSASTDSLKCEATIHLSLNPNQTEEVIQSLASEVAKLAPILRKYENEPEPTHA